MFTRRRIQRASKYCPIGTHSYKVFLKIPSTETCTSQHKTDWNTNSTIPVCLLSAHTQWCSVNASISWYEDKHT